jgi:hypothetical protein
MKLGLELEGRLPKLLLVGTYTEQMYIQLISWFGTMKGGQAVMGGATCN